MRFGNAAVSQVQHDAYGSVILSAMPMFFDRRLPQPGGETSVPPDREAGAQMRGAGAGAGCRHLGISRPQPHPHPFRRHVLGRHQPRPRAIASAAGASRPRRVIGTARRQNRRSVILKRCWNEKRQAFAAADGHRRHGCQRLAVAGIGTDRCARSALRLHGGGDRKRSGATAAMSCAMRRQTISACRKRNSWSAASG